MNGSMCSLSSTLFVTQCPPSSFKSRNLIVFMDDLYIILSVAILTFWWNFQSPPLQKKSREKGFVLLSFRGFSSLWEKKCGGDWPFNLYQSKCWEMTEKNSPRYSLCTYPFNDEHTPYPQTSLSTTPPSPKHLFTIDSIDGVNHWVDMSTHNFICLEMIDTCRGVAY